MILHVQKASVRLVDVGARVPESRFAARENHAVSSDAPPPATGLRSAPFYEWAARVIRIEARFRLKGHPTHRVLGMDEDDCVQQVLMQYIDSGAHDRFDPTRGPLGTYVRRFTRSRMIELLRVQRRRIELGEATHAVSVDPEALVSDRADPHALAEAKQMSGALTAYLEARVPPDRHTWIRALFVEDQSNAEFAAQRGVTPNQIACFKHRVRTLISEFYEASKKEQG